jgi:drug/metabolite transporter (DMT)-like permease
LADVPYLPAAGVAVERRPATGYAMVAAAACLFGLNGTVAKIILSSGLGSLRLTEMRCTGAFVGLLAIVLATRPARMWSSRRELTYLACFGVLGVALVQLFYFLSIQRLEVGVALVIQYLAPLLVALWARFVEKEHVRRRLWAALALALVGLTLVVDLWRGVSLDGLGVVFALLGAATFAAYLLLAEHAIGRRDAVSLLCFGFLFATLFWAIVQPWWSFPFAVAGERASLHGNLASFHLPVWALITWMIAAGTIVPFFLMVGALQHLPATRVGVIAMLEPVVGALVAFAWLDETLAAEQLVGGAIVLAGIVLAQTSR